MSTILIAAIVWAVFLVSNIITGFVMYRLGLHGQLRLWQKKINETEELVENVTDKLNNTYIPGSEFNPFETQPSSRYELYRDQEFVSDPVVPIQKEVKMSDSR